MRPFEPHPLLARAAVVVLAVGLYLGTLGHGFVYDDAILIENQEIVRGHRFLEAFTTPYHTGATTKVETGAYRPLTILSFALQHALHGERPGPYHAVNVALHGAVSLLALETALVAGLPLAAATGAALLFAAHPVHAEAVAGLAGRADLLSAAFFLLALMAYARLREVATGPPSGPALVSASLALLAALAAKEAAIVFPAVALSWEILVRRPTDVPVGIFLRTRLRELVRAVGVLMVPVVVYLAARAAALGSLVPSAGALSPLENPVAELGLLERWPTVLAVAGRYVVLALYPAQLSPDWGWAELTPVRSAGDPYAMLGAAALLAAFVGFAFAVRRSRQAAFALAFGAITYAIVSNAFVLIGTGMAERLLYLPSLAVCLLAALAWWWPTSRAGSGVAWTLAMVVLVGASTRTVTAAAAWRDDATLFGRAVEAAPRSVRVLENLGVELARRGRLDEARRRLEAAVELAPDSVPARINLAGVLLGVGELGAAEAQVRRALSSEPGNATALAQLGAVLRRRGDLEGAERAFARAVEADPRFLAPRVDLAGLLLARGAHEEARRQLEQVLRLEPTSVTAIRGLGLVALAEGDRSRAIENLDRARRLSPDDPAIAAELEAARALPER